MYTEIFLKTLYDSAFFSEAILSLFNENNFLVLDSTSSSENYTSSDNKLFNRHFIKLKLLRKKSNNSFDYDVNTIYHCILNIGSILGKPLQFSNFPFKENEQKSKEIEVEISLLRQVWM